MASAPTYHRRTADRVGAKPPLCRLRARPRRPTRQRPCPWSWREASPASPPVAGVGRSLAPGQRACRCGAGSRTTGRRRTAEASPLRATMGAGDNGGGCNGRVTGVCRREGYRPVTRKRCATTGFGRGLYLRLMSTATLAAPTATPAGLPTTHRTLVLTALVMASFMSSIEATIVATAMPNIAAKIGGFGLYAWVFSSYLLMQGTMTPVFGKLADMFGRKPVFLVGLGIFLVGSVLCGFAPDDGPARALPARAGHRCGGGAAAHDDPRGRPLHARGAPARAGRARQRVGPLVHPRAARGRPHRGPRRLALGVLDQRALRPHRGLSGVAVSPRARRGARPADRLRRGDAALRRRVGLHARAHAEHRLGLDGGGGAAGGVRRRARLVSAPRAARGRPAHAPGAVAEPA